MNSNHIKFDMINVINVILIKTMQQSNNKSTEQIIAAVLSNDLSSLAAYNKLSKNDDFSSYNLDRYDSSGWTPLHYAIVRNKFSIAQFLINAANVDVFKVTKQLQETSLHLAVKFNDIDIFKMLLNYGFSEKLFFSVNKFGENILHYIIKYNSSDILDWVISKWYNQLVKLMYKGNYINNYIPLHYAVQKDNTKIVDNILTIMDDTDIEENKSYNINTNTNNNILHLISINGNTKILYHILNKYNNGTIIRLSYANNNMYNLPLHEAYINNNLDIFNILLKYVSIDVPDIYNNSILHKIICSPRQTNNLNKSILSLISEYKADIYATNIEGITPIHNLITTGNITVLIYLITNYNIDISQRDIYGNTILHYAANSCCTETARELLKYIDHEYLLYSNNNGFTPIFISLINGDTQMTRYLYKMMYKYKGDTIFIDNNLCLAPHYAAYYGHIDILRFLLKKKSNILNHLDSNKCSILHYAVLNNHINIVRYLVFEKKINIDSKNILYKTALDIAKDKNLDDIISIIDKLTYKSESSDTEPF